MHAVKDKPVVVDGQIVIRPIMVVALTYDHRLLDGREAVTFLGTPFPLLYAESLSLLSPFSESERVYRGPQKNAPCIGSYVTGRIEHWRRLLAFPYSYGLYIISLSGVVVKLLGVVRSIASLQI